MVEIPFHQYNTICGMNLPQPQPQRKSYDFRHKNSRKTRSRADVVLHSEDISSQIPGCVCVLFVCSTTSGMALIHDRYVWECLWMLDGRCTFLCLPVWTFVLSEKLWISNTYIHTYIHALLARLRTPTCWLRYACLPKIYRFLTRSTHCGSC